MRLRCPVIIGRDGELARLRELVEGVRSGHGGAVGLVGEAGVGKTRLADEALRLAEGADLSGLVGRTTHIGQQTWLAPYAGALAGIAARDTRNPLPALADLRPLLAHLLPAFGDAAFPAIEPSPVLIGDAFVRAVAAATDGALVVLEDIHDMADDALSVLAHILATVAAEPIGVVCTLRPRAGSAADALEVLRRAAVETVRLRALGPDHAAQLALSCMPGLDMASELEALLAAAEGLPLLIEDLLAEAVDDGQLTQADTGWVWSAPWQVAVPEAYAQVVERRLTSLPPESAAVVRAAAVLGRRFTPAMLAAAADRPLDEIDSAVRHAVAAQLFDADGGAFRHALTRDAVLAGTPSSTRAVVARHAVEGVATFPPDMEPVQAELLATAGSPDDAATLLARVAAREAASGALASAGDRLSRARELAVDRTLAADLAVRHVRMLTTAGNLLGARAQVALMRSFLPVEQRIDVELALARSAVAAGDPSTAASDVLTAKSLMSADDRHWAELWAIEALVALVSPDNDRIRTAEHLAHRAVAAARELGDRRAECEAWLVVGRCARMRDLAEAEQAFSVALDLANADGLTVSRLRALHELGTVEMFRDVTADRLRLARQEGLAAGALVSVASIDINLAATLLMRGEYDEAVAVARGAAELAERIGVRDVLPIAWCWQGIAAGYQGDRGAAEQLFARAEATAPDDPDVASAANMLGRGVIALLREDRTAADAALARAAAHGQPLMSDPTQSIATLLLAVDGRQRLADIDRLPTVSHSQWTALWIDTARAVVVGRSDAELATTLLENNLRTLRRYPVFGLIALRQAGEAALVDGWGRPLTWLREVEREAAAGGHQLMASAARTLLRRAGARVTRQRAVDASVPDELRHRGITAREFEVLQLFVDRPTNTDLATRLHLSVRTVEKHVASLLMKLDLRSRADLHPLASSVAAERGWSPPMT